MPWEKQFDVREVVAKAKQAFWTHGYDGIGLNDLLDHMGIQKGSFYATFGSKKKVFLEALRQFVDERFADSEALVRAASPREALIQHFKEIADEAVGADGPLGCFMANTAIDQAPKDDDIRAFVVATFDRHIQLYRRTIDAGKRLGEWSADFDSLGTARALFAMVVGLRVMARVGMPKAAIFAVRDQTFRLLLENSSRPA